MPVFSKKSLLCTGGRGRPGGCLGRPEDDDADDEDSTELGGGAGRGGSRSRAPSARHNVVAPSDGGPDVGSGDPESFKFLLTLSQAVFEKSEPPTALEFEHSDMAREEPPPPPSRPSAKKQPRRVAAKRSCGGTASKEDDPSEEEAELVVSEPPQEDFLVLPPDDFRFFLTVHQAEITEAAT